MEERFHYLFKRYLDGNGSQKELEEFFALIRKADHDDVLRQMIRKAYDGVKATDSTSAFVDKQGRLVLQNKEVQETITIPIKSKQRKRYTAIAVAATIVIAAGLFAVFLQPVHSEKQGTVASLTKKATDRSELKFIMLEDSTRVWLNAASSLEFPDHFEGEKREVYLTGEAFFDVKHADNIPFIIHTGDVATTVLGTSFNIKAYPGQKAITVAVSNGKVKVTRKDDLVAVLTKGQQVKIEENKPKAAEKAIAVTKVAAWQQGDLVFDDESLRDIVADIQRIYNVSVRLSDKIDKEALFSTSFRKEIGIEQALQVLCRLTDTEFSIKEGEYIIQ